jgi:molybdenum cofactor cytidylyltransferase
MKKEGLIAIFLAAGKSSRMGVNKLSLPLSTYTIGSSALQTALLSSIDHVLVVTKKEDSLIWMNPLFFHPPYSSQWTHIVCDDAEKGQAHSLQRGFQVALSMDPRGMMILLADQPYLSEVTIEKVIKTYEQSATPVDFVAARYEGIPRPPVIFSPRVPSLMKLKGDIGARKLLQELDGRYVECSNDRDFLDIDTKEDYEMVIGGETRC